ncbi:MAG TPA: hypothetical protein VME23_09850 [Terracidiphilus sp.]|nr:hypothetical protein [Terracidiphilus sp.]
MPTTGRSQFDAAALSRLACHGDLNLGNEVLACAGCGRVYRIADGIPVLITERAEIGHSSGAQPLTTDH